MANSLEPFACFQIRCWSDDLSRWALEATDQGQCHGTTCLSTESALGKKKKKDLWWMCNQSGSFIFMYNKWPSLSSRLRVSKSDLDPTRVPWVIQMGTWRHWSGPMSPNHMPVHKKLTRFRQNLEICWDHSGSLMELSRKTGSGRAPLRDTNRPF